MSEGAPHGPPGTKRVVVLREGPPRGRGKVLDGALGVVGAVLILLSVLLVNVLPETEVPDPQYRVEYASVVHEITDGTVFSDEVVAGGVLPPGEAQAVLLPIEVEHNNVFEIVGQFFLEEDREETLPDIFIVELLRPDGTVIQTSNPQPTLPTCDVAGEDGQYSTPGEYYRTCDRNAGQLTRIAFNLGGKPADEIVTFDDGRNATLEEAEAALVQRDTEPTIGTWSFRVWLAQVGQCPETDPGSGLPSQSEQQRVTVCRLAVEQENGSPGGTDDPGNRFTLSKLEYTYYTIQVSEP